jgi:hypothetical protein
MMLLLLNLKVFIPHHKFLCVYNTQFTLIFCILLFHQIALVQHLMPKELCNAPIVAKLRWGIGFMQMVPDHHRMQTMMNGAMMKTFMMLLTQIWQPLW